MHRADHWCKTLAIMKQSVDSKYDSEVSDCTVAVVMPARKLGEIEVLQSDSFTYAATVLERNSSKRVAVLNFANPVRPALGSPLGSTQEEDLMRRSNLGLWLYSDLDSLRGKPNLYPMKPRDIIYSSDITLLSDRNGVPYSQPYTLDVITAAAIIGPSVIPNLDDYADERDRALMTDKLTACLLAAINHKVDVLVLGAFGCGAFRCPLTGTAEIFKTLLQKYRYCFDTIAFPIPDSRTCLPFIKVLA